MLIAIINKIELVLDEEEIELYKVFDQVNLILNQELSENPKNKVAYELFIRLRGGTLQKSTNVLMVSGTNEASIKPDQDYPRHEIPWREPCKEAERKFITDSFELDL